jgi:hypothetical protein
MRKKINKSLILNRIKQACNLEGNSDLSRFLGVSPNTITNWYNRNSIDFDLVFSKCENINSEWLLTGQGSMLKQNVLISTETANTSASETACLQSKDSNKSEVTQENSNILKELLQRVESLSRENGRLQLENEYLRERISKLIEESEKNTI